MIGAAGRRRIIGVGLMLMSFSSGCVDILSYRFLGQVFTSAMTGNVALMGLDLGQRDFGAASRNMTALASFLAGLAAGAGLLRNGAARPALLLTLGLETLLLLCFGALWRLHGVEVGVYILIGLSAVAMGAQTAVAYRVGMPGISTTYFTGTLTGIVFGLIAPDTARPRRAPRRVAWPLLAFLAYATGAAIAGWYAAGHAAPDLPIGLPLLPCAATVVLAGLIAVVGEQAGHAS